MQLSSILPSSSVQQLRRLRSLRVRTGRDVGEHPASKSLSTRLVDVFLRTWDLGFTAFGGPPVHFQILHRRFVEGQGREEKWVDEQTYQELFAICQGLPGPASTKMLFCLAFLHAGLVPAVFTFLVWSLPGAIGMYGLSLGVQRINEVLPSPVYALLSGLNASTVGIIALAAVQLAEKAIRDKLSRILVIFGAAAGLCYNALWYLPTLMVVGGFACVLWDGFLSQRAGKFRARLRRRKDPAEPLTAVSDPGESIALEEGVGASSIALPTQTRSSESQRATGTDVDRDRIHQGGGTTQSTNDMHHTVRIRSGLIVAILFFASFIAVLVARGLLHPAPLPFDLFASMYLAGTVIFGGGPVVIPLLRSYVVDPGWVTSRDFLIGLAVIQAFPGPNFNFAVYLGALALQRSRFPTALGAILGYVGIFLPGGVLVIAVQSFWRVLRKKKWVIDLLRGVNATAVGLVFTAVYRLWEIGYLTPHSSNGQSLGLDPWWVVVATLAYAESAWFKVPPAIAILFGGALGLAWYGAVRHGR